MDTLQAISVDQIDKWYNGNELWATTVVEQSNQNDSTSIPVPVQAVLDKYQEVFQEPKDLPPHRSFDHAITLLPGTAPVNSRPYRYSPMQKHEIERLISESQEQ